LDGGETSGTTKQNNIAIVNIAGQELINSPISKPKTQIDISNLPSGVYFVWVTNDKSVGGKIIMQ
jgi:hypothetical protein